MVLVLIMLVCFAKNKHARSGLPCMLKMTVPTDRLSVKRLWCNLQDQQQQLGQQLTQQLEHLHRAVQAGVAVDPVTMAAAATAAAAATGQGAAIAAHTAAAVGHPAVAVSFLKDLAAFGKGVAAGMQRAACGLCVLQMIKVTVGWPFWLHAACQGIQN